MLEQNEMTEKEKYLSAYVQIQERYIADLIRNKITAEIQSQVLNEAINQLKTSNESLEQQLFDKDNIIKQSTNSITILTKENETIKKIAEDRLNTINLLNIKLENMQSLENVNASQQREIERINNELRELNEMNKDYEMLLKNFQQKENNLMEIESENSLVKKQRPKTKRSSMDVREEPLIINTEEF